MAHFIEPTTVRWVACTRPCLVTGSQRLVYPLYQPFT